jgi:cell division control protein 24
MKSRLSVQPLQPRGGIQIYPAPSTAAQERRISLSLFQQCLLVRSRLSRDPTFARYLEKVVLSPLHNPRDPVNHLWDFFCLGISLCHLYNCVPGTPHLPMTVSTDVSMLDATPDSEGAKKHAIMTFAMHVRSLDPEWDHLMVTDIVNDRVSLDGFMKVSHLVFMASLA